MQCTRVALHLLGVIPLCWAVAQDQHPPSKPSEVKLSTPGEQKTAGPCISMMCSVHSLLRCTTKRGSPSLLQNLARGCPKILEGPIGPCCGSSRGQEHHCPTSNVLQCVFHYKSRGLSSCRGGDSTLLEESQGLMLSLPVEPKSDSLQLPRPMH